MNHIDLAYLEWHMKHKNGRTLLVQSHVHCSKNMRLYLYLHGRDQESSNFWDIFDLVVVNQECN